MMSIIESLHEGILSTINTAGRPALPESLDGFRDDIQKEFVHADDVVNWIHTLSPNPSIELLLAGRFHDWERVVYPGSTEGFAGDRNSLEYHKYKKAHAARSADLVISTFLAAGLPEVSVCRIAQLVFHHDDTGEEIRFLNDPELDILVSADSLSFFTCIAPDMISRNVAEDQIRGKMKFMMGKMNDHARHILQDWRSPNAEVEKLKNEVIQQFS